ncbi:MAG TPA: glycosyltransferase [Polyangiaceae bacterium]|nr:glycosyltransferase [Polyangiaceae bacterium]
MIPAIAHFIWLTPDFPWLNVLAVRSAALRGGFERVVVHVTHEPSHELDGVPGVEVRRLDPAALLRDPSLLARYHELSSPAARSNLLRAAILEREGGVYLDMDTVTIRDLSSLRAGRRFFCGLEHVAFPAPQPGQSAAALRSRGMALTAMREGMRHAPGGWRYFRKVEHLFPRAANNAVLGATPGHPFLNELLERMARMPRQSALRRYALGTHLLQRALAQYDADDLAVFGPSVFYPLGPRISRHWFARCRHPDLQGVVSGDTRVVHWYASLHTEFERINPQFLRENADTQLFARLVREFQLLEATKKTSPSSVMP